MHTNGKLNQMSRALVGMLMSFSVAAAAHFTYRGAWSQPGLGGHDSDVFLNADNTTITYNTFLKRYLALGTTSRGTDYLATCTDLARQNWTPME